MWSEILLTRVVSSSSFAFIDDIRLDYASIDEVAGNMLDFRDQEVYRLDSLYSYRSEYYQGKFANGDMSYDPLANAPNAPGFSSWLRYLHSRHDALQPNYNGYSIDRNNPYIGRDGNGNAYLFEESATPSSDRLSFNHGYLESPRIGEGTGFNLRPGDIYELRTVATGPSGPVGFLNLDLHLATGKDVSHTTLSGGRVNIDLGFPKEESTRESVFSTFGKALKWNTQGHQQSGSQIVNSNYFVMPHLPDENNGFHIQVGPANTDMVHDLDPLNAEDVQTPGITGPKAFQAYEHFQLSGWQSGHLKASQPTPRNFGLGLPWWQMRFLYDPLTNFDPEATSSVFDFWWNNANYQPAHGWTNTPTRAGSNAYLDAVELIRYSKNPYMLTGVRVYKVNGETNGITDPGLVLVDQLELSYSRQLDVLVDNKRVPAGTLANFSQQHYANYYLLDRIARIPTHPSENNPAAASYVPGETPTVHFTYRFNTHDVILDSTVRTNTGGVLLTKVTNHLGGETLINYYPLTGTQTILNTRNQPVQPCGSGPLSNMNDPVAVEINYAVKSVA
ncbi:MAG: hypothetical protein AAGB22_04500, partial [Bacteroidota bacterium]